MSRPSSRASLSSVNSYSVNLDALLPEHDDHTASSIPLPAPQDVFDVVRTDDIDGPTDFTQNMEFWMRAPLPEKLHKPNVVVPGRLQESGLKNDLEDYVDSDDVELKSSPRSEARKVAHERDEDLDSMDEGFGGSQSPTAQESGSETAKGTDDEGHSRQTSISSVAPKDGLGLEVPRVRASPSPNARLDSAADRLKEASLQPTVEDYEDTPRRPPVTPRRVHDPQSDNIIDQSSQLQSLERQMRQQKAESDARIAELESLLKNARDQLDRLQRSTQVHQNQMQQEYNAKFEKFWTDSKAHHEEIEQEYQIRFERQEKAWSERLRAADEQTRAAKEQKELQALQTSDLQLQLEALRESHQAELEEQKEEFETRLDELQSGLDRTREFHAEDLRLREASFSSEIADLQLQVKSAKILLDQTTSANRKALETVRADAEKTVQQLEAESKAKTLQYQSRTAELESTLQAAESSAQKSNNSRISALEAKLKASETSSQQALEAFRATHAQELEQEKAGSVARTTALEAQVKALQAQLHGSAKASTDSIASNAENALLSAQMMDLEARFATALEQLESARADARTKNQELVRILRECEDLEDTSAASKSRVIDVEARIEEIRAQLERMGNEMREAREEARLAKEREKEVRDELAEAKANAPTELKKMEMAQRGMVQENTELKSRITELEAYIEGLRNEHKSKLEDMRRRAEEAVLKAGDLIEKEKAAKLKAKKELKAAKSELQALREETFIKTRIQTDAVSSDEITFLRDALRAQREATKRAQDSAKDAQAAAEAAQAETEAARAETVALREDYEAINAALDERITQLMRSREREWAAKLEKARKERKELGKALLQEWGREELGKGEPQLYRYKFVKRLDY